jgi:hypothetical protein
LTAILSLEGIGAIARRGPLAMRLPHFMFSLLLLAALASWAPARAENASPAASPGLPDLALRVLPRNNTCGEAEICRVVIHVLNQGDAPYDGPLSVFLDLHAPAVSEPPSADGPPCVREDYGKFSCHLDNVSLPPGGYAVIEPEFLFTATAFESSNACASLRWTPPTLALRDRLLAAAVQASGHSAEELAKAAGLSAGEASRSRLLAALLGRWGEGDAISADDTACATIGIVTIRHEASCPEGSVSLDGVCTPLAQWCPSNRQHLGGPDRCACPTPLAYWNSETGKCEAQPAKLACAATEADPAQACRCPADRPVLNASKGACVAVGKVAAAAPPPPKPAQPQVAMPSEPAVKPVAKSAPSVATTKPAPKVQAAKPEPVVETAKTETRPSGKKVQTALLEPEQPKPRRIARKPAPARAASNAGKRRCRGLQVWGPNLHRCVPMTIYLMGRIFAPHSAAAECPVGQHLVNGRCRK